jgi:hypothetical protein
MKNRMQALGSIILSTIVFAGQAINPALVYAVPPTIGGCQVFPTDNAWNQDISALPVHPNSSNYIKSIGASQNLHPDFGSGTWEGQPIGIPYLIVDNGDPLVPINFTAYGDESDAGPYRVPLNAPIEGGSSSDGDRHAIAVDIDNCMLYELYRAFPQGASWNADSGATYDLTSNAVRPAGWTSADAAGLPIFPGLAKYDEVNAGEVTHALRFTVAQTQRKYIAPARHYASSSTNPDLPPMGLRVRLKAGYNISGFSPQAQVILQGLKTYGMILADNGSDWYISGEPNAGWDNDELSDLKDVPGSAFEVVDTLNNIYPIYRLYSPSKGVHFYTLSDKERSKLTSTNTGWEYEKEAFSAHKASVVGSTAVYRFLNLLSGRHFYTIKTSERDKLINSDQWQYEGIAYYAYAAAGVDRKELYRFYSPSRGAHLFTTSLSERNKIISLYSATWNYEGTAFYVL